MTDWKELSPDDRLYVFSLLKEKYIEACNELRFSDTRLRAETKIRAINAAVQALTDAAK